MSVEIASYVDFVSENTQQALSSWFQKLYQYHNLSFGCVFEYHFWRGLYYKVAVVNSIQASNSKKKHGREKYQKFRNKNVNQPLAFTICKHSTTLASQIHIASIEHCDF